MKKAVFIDRDGVINEIIYHNEMGILDSPFTVDQIHILPNVAKAIKKFKKLGFLTIIVSNQPGVAKNHFTLEAFEDMKEKIRSELEKQDATVNYEYYCIHHPYGKNPKYTKICKCRKPKPGMLKQAAIDHDIDLEKSWMIGDGITDIQAGSAAGCKTILIGRTKCDLCKKLDDEGAKPDFIIPTLYEASEIVEKNL